jgi:hypothetical protein
LNAATRMKWRAVIVPMTHKEYGKRIAIVVADSRRRGRRRRSWKL